MTDLRARLRISLVSALKAEQLPHDYIEFLVGLNAELIQIRQRALLFKEIEDESTGNPFQDGPQETFDQV